MKFPSLISFLVFILTAGFCYSNQIDSIKTQEDALNFVRSKFPKIIHDHTGSFSDPDKKISDSLHSFRWIKVDIDQNGQTDLIIIGDMNMPAITTILSFNDTFKLETIEFFDSYLTFYPVLKTINNQQLLLLYNENDSWNFDYKAKPSSFGLKCDTLIFSSNGFINYHSNSSHHNIDSITINMHMGGDPISERIEIIIYSKYLQGYGLKKIYDDQRIETSTHIQLSNKQVKSILELLENSNFPDFIQDPNMPYLSHCPAAHITISYDGNKTKIIEDRCLQQNYTLMQVYNTIRSIEWDAR